MSWDQRIPNEGLFARQQSSYFPTGNNYISRPINTRQDIVPTLSVTATTATRDINMESRLYSLNYYNPNDCMTKTEYKHYLKGQIESNLLLTQHHLQGTVKDKRWDINTRDDDTIY
jgi:hypothetical protein